MCLHIHKLPIFCTIYTFFNDPQIEPKTDQWAQTKTWPRPRSWTRSEPDPEPRVRVGESESNQTFGRVDYCWRKGKLCGYRDRHLVASSMTLSRRGEPAGVDTVTAGRRAAVGDRFSPRSIARLKTWRRSCDFTSEGDYCYCFPVQVRLADDRHDVDNSWIIIQFITTAVYIKEHFTRRSPVYIFIL